MLLFPSKPVWHNDWTAIYQGHNVDVLATMPERSVHCCVTSPPYYNLRGYQTKAQVWPQPNLAPCAKGEHVWHREQVYREGGGAAESSAEAFSEPGPRNAERLRQARWKTQTFCTQCGAWRGELGQEPTVALYLAHLVLVFRAVKRVLRDDGTCWINIGDSYEGSGKGEGSHKGPQRKRSNATSSEPVYPASTHEGSVPEKSLFLVPERLAVALQDDGWIVRKVIVWDKISNKPESMTDRPTSAHERLLMLSKKPRYFYDQNAEREPMATTPEQAQSKWASRRAGVAKGDAEGITHGGGVPFKNDPNPEGRNMRDVWRIAGDSVAEAHFATFPREIPRRVIKLATSEFGVCASCGAPRVRVLARSDVTHRREPAHTPGSNATKVDSSGWQPARIATKQSVKTCACDAETVPATVLDPFFGSGRTGEVAAALMRRCLGVELQARYVKIAQDRLDDGALPLTPGQYEQDDEGPSGPTWSPTDPPWEEIQ